MTNVIIDVRVDEPAFDRLGLRRDLHLTVTAIGVDDEEAAREYDPVMLAQQDIYTSRGQS